MPTVCELKIQAKEKGLIGYSRMKKSELEAALKEPVKKIKAKVKKSEAPEPKPKAKAKAKIKVESISSPKPSPQKSPETDRNKNSMKLESIEEKLANKKFDPTSIKKITTVDGLMKLTDDLNAITKESEDYAKKVNYVMNRITANSRRGFLRRRHKTIKANILKRARELGREGKK